MPRLIDTQRSGNAWKVRLLAGLLGLRLERTTLSIDRGDLRDPGFLALAPLGQVPVLVLDTGEAIAESMAILHHLAQGSPFWPDDRLQQAEVLTWLSFEQAQHMHPLAQLRLHLALHRDRSADSPDMLALRAQALRALGQLEARLASRPAPGWLAGSGPTIADVALYPYTCLATMGGIDLAPFSAIRDWLRRIEALPGYAPLFPGQPERNFSSTESTTAPQDTPMSNSFNLGKDALMQRAYQQMDKHLEASSFSLEQKLALTCRILFDNGHDSGLAGQITARAAEPGTYLTQRLGLGFDEISAANLLLVDEHLTVLRGDGMANPANRFHSWVYRARPDVQCIVHTHAQHVAALSMLELPLQISHMDNCVLYDEVAFVPKWPGVPVGNEEGELISTALGSKRALLLGHHGLLVAAQSVEEACVLALALERAARLQLLAMAAGTIQPIDPALGREAHDWILRPQRSSTSFAYYARRSLRTHGDCL